MLGNVERTKWILDTIEKCKCEEGTKEFLKGIVLFELGSLESGGKHWKSTYDSMIERFTEKEK